MFDGSLWHQPEDWDGKDRWVVSAFVPRDVRKTLQEHWDELEDLGFPVSGVRDRLQELCPDSEMEPMAKEEGKPSLKEIIAWEVEVPVPYVTESDLLSWQLGMKDLLGLAVCLPRKSVKLSYILRLLLV